MNGTRLVMHFNHFTGKLMGGYVMRDRNSAGYMTASEVIEYLRNNPDVSCEPMKV
jgi:hypothetical protein